MSAFWAAVWWWNFHEDPRQHPGITNAELAALPAANPAGQIGSGPVPWRRLIPRVTPLMIIYFCQGWTGWLYVTWMPSLFQKNYGLDLKKSSLFYAAMLLCAMIAELLGGVVTDYLLRRTRSLQIARSLLIAVSWVLAVAGLVPGDTDPRPRYRPRRLHGRAVLSRLCDFAAVDRDDGHRAELRRLFEFADECCRRRRRDTVAGRVRLDPATAPAAGRRRSRFPSACCCSRLS